jgi:glycolate oxidase subunit GlcD
MTAGALRHELAAIVGEEFALGGDDARYLADQTAFSAIRGAADAVVLPADAAQVAAVVAWCHEQGVPVVPRGGGTGWAGGAVPLGTGVVVALERMAAVRSLDPLQWRMHVEAGVTTATVRRLARENGLCFPPDPGAAEQSQIGGNLATNAGGPHCFKYGVTGDWVTGIEAVLSPGTIVRLGGAARKDVAGYDLSGLLVGSEGTLGIITAAWLRLIPAPAGSWPACAFYRDADAGGEAVARVMAAGPVAAAIEYLDGGALAIVGGGFPGGVPADAGFLVIAESDTGSGDGEALAQALGEGAIGGVVLPPDPAALWRWRDGVGPAVTAVRGGKLSDDIAVPVERLADAVREVEAIGVRHRLESCSWGHAGDGNLHATFLIDPRDDLAVHRARRAADELLAMAIEMGGTISGEHGIGVLKNGWLSRQWGPAAVAAHEAVKDALDPTGMFNPGKKLA